MLKVAPYIETERLIVRLANVEDVESMVAFYRDNEPHLGPWEPARPDDFFTEERWLAAIPKCHAEFIDDKSLRLCMFKQSESSKIIGTVNFTNITRRAAQYCNLGYSVAAAEEGQGYMLEGVSAALVHVFTEMNMHRVMANYMPRNARSGKLLRRLGFTIEGYAREYLRINGRWEDHILTSLTNVHWKGA